MAHPTGERTDTTDMTWKTAATNGLRTRRNAGSPFLRLPLELKTQIYEYVCGGETIHIYRDGHDLSHQLCGARLSEEEAQQRFDAARAKWYEPETADRHMSCRGHTTVLQDCPTCRPYSKDPGSRTETLETNILRCCRQMHRESEYIPYYANTFSFASAMSLDRFCRQTPERYQAEIRSLHVHLVMFVGGPCKKPSWELALETVATCLRGLQRIYITMELLPGKAEPPFEDQPPFEESRVLTHILQLGKLDLKIATVVLWDNHFTHDWFGTAMDEREAKERWTLAQKQEWSGYLRKALLQYEFRDSELAFLKREASEQGRICRL